MSSLLKKMLILLVTIGSLLVVIVLKDGKVVSVTTHDVSERESITETTDDPDEEVEVTVDDETEADADVEIIDTDGDDAEEDVEDAVEDEDIDDDEQLEEIVEDCVDDADQEGVDVDDDNDVDVEVIEVDPFDPDDDDGNDDDEDDEEDEVEEGDLLPPDDDPIVVEVDEDEEGIDIEGNLEYIDWDRVCVRGYNPDNEEERPFVNFYLNGRVMASARVYKNELINFAYKDIIGWYHAGDERHESYELLVTVEDPETEAELVAFETDEFLMYNTHLEEGELELTEWCIKRNKDNRRLGTLKLWFESEKPGRACYRVKGGRRGDRKKGIARNEGGGVYYAKLKDFPCPRPRFWPRSGGAYRHAFAPRIWVAKSKWRTAFEVDTLAGAYRRDPA